MVYYFNSIANDPSLKESARIIYMGRDKYENDDLIKFGNKQVIWFHVDNLSSAHVYLNLLPNENWTDIPEDVLIDCAQLTKANSIQGNKRDNITIIYTPWSNLKKSKGMNEGEVSFRNDKLIKKIHVQTRDNSIINRLKKTRQEILGREHLIMLKDAKDKEINEMILKRQKEEKDRANEEKKRIADEKRKKETLYDDLWDDDEKEKSSNQRRMYDPEEDFM